MPKKVHRIEFEITGSSAPPGLLKQVQESIAELNLIYAKKIEPLSTVIVVDRVFLLTKEEPTNEEMAIAFISVAVHDLITSDLKNWDIEGIARGSDFLRDWWSRIESDRQRFKSRLDELVANPQQAAEIHLESDLTVQRNDLLLVPWMNARNEHKERNFPMTIEAAYVYALSRLTENNFAYLDRVVKCLGCGCYFLRKVSPYGGAPRKHCSTTCRRKLDHQKALIRQAKPEQRKKQAERKRKKLKESKK